MVFSWLHMELSYLFNVYIWFIEFTILYGVDLLLSIIVLLQKLLWKLTWVIGLGHRPQMSL